MKRHEFLDVVPQPVQIAACAIVCFAVLVGLIAGAVHSQVLGRCAISPVLQSLGGMAIGLFVGSLIAIWILCLGYVYADAPRRAMPPVLWTCVAALVPNLLGFLLYFAMRQPIASACPSCGEAVASNRRFCSWCGYDTSSSGNDRPHSAGMAPGSSDAI